MTEPLRSRDYKPDLVPCRLCEQESVAARVVLLEMWLWMHKNLSWEREARAIKTILEEGPHA